MQEDENLFYTMIYDFFWPAGYLKEIFFDNFNSCDYSQLKVNVRVTCQKITLTFPNDVELSVFTDSYLKHEHTRNLSLNFYSIHYMTICFNEKFKCKHEIFMDKVTKYLPYMKHLKDLKVYYV
jgi:hypothetical protein